MYLRKKDNDPQEEAFLHVLVLCQGFKVCGVGWGSEISGYDAGALCITNVCPLGEDKGSATC